MSYADIEIKSTNNFLKIENGTPHDIRLLSETPVSSLIHGFGAEKVPCTGKGCLACIEGPEAKQRFSADVWDWTLKKQVVWEFGVSIAKKLKSIDATLQEEGRKITEVDLKIETEGEKLQKKTNITPRMTAKPLPPEAEPNIPF